MASGPFHSPDILPGATARAVSASPGPRDTPSKPTSPASLCPRVRRAIGTKGLRGLHFEGPGLMRDNARAKAGRLLVGGAVSILGVTQHRCTASVKGDTATHAVTFDGDRWTCDCAAVGPCSHALAVARVVAVHAEREHKVVMG